MAVSAHANPFATRQIGGRHGATGGLGYETALALTKAGAEVIQSSVVCVYVVLV
jgi:hypothetical protein